MVVVVVGMEEIMGSKRGRRWWLRVAGQGKQEAAVRGLWLAANEGEEKK